MNEIIKERLKSYKSSNSEHEKDAMREIIQEIALLGLWRSKFFEHTAFYGGTALRILYGLDRFSEDLDFTALVPHQDFKMAPYLQAVKEELAAYGFDASVETKLKSIASKVESAFIKADTQMHFLAIGSRFKAQKGEMLRVKFEVDIDPATGFTTEAKQFFWPQVFSVVTCDLPSLFAGKLHATFCRKRVRNVKGRDWYDLLWYLGRGVKPNLFYLENKLRQSGNWPIENRFDIQSFKEWAKGKVLDLDITAARQDVERFIADPRKIDGWSREAFLAAVELLG